MWLLVEVFQLKSVRKRVGALIALLKQWLRMLEPYLIIIGLIAIVGGAFLVGYATLKQSRDMTALKGQLSKLTIPLPSPQPGSTKRELMLTGRIVSGLEVVQRLEQLETEIDSTKKELSDTKQKLANAQTPKTPTTRLGTLGPPPLPQENSNATPPKFYSPRNKNELADALTDLSGILNANADEIVRKTQTFINTWNNQATLIAQQRVPDTIALGGQLDALANATVVLSRSFFDDDGLIEKHKTYADEMKNILQISLNASSNPLSVLQRSINGLRDGVSTIELASKYSDQRLTAQMMQNMRPMLDNLVSGDNAFRNWLAQTRQRIDAFRNTLG